MKIDPLHQFEIKKIFDISVFGVDISFTNSSLYMSLSLLAVLFVFILGTFRKSLIPSKFQMCVELIYDFVRNIIDENIGDEGKKYKNFIFSIFLFVLFGNLIGMIPYSFTITSHIVVTFILAMFVFLMVIFVGLQRHGFHFLTIFFPEGAPKIMAPVLVPIEILSFLSRPVSLSVRLFANMMAGHTLLKVFAGFSLALGFFSFAPIFVNAALIGLEFLVAFLQAYVFTILTCLYLKDAIHLH